MIKQLVPIFLGFIFVAVFCKKEDNTLPLESLSGSIVLINQKTVRQVNANDRTKDVLLGKGYFNDGGIDLKDITPDKSRALFVKDAQLILTDSFGTSLLIFDLPKGANFQQAKISPDGQKVALIQSTKKLTIIDLKQGKIIHEFQPESPVISKVGGGDGLGWSPDGQNLALTEWQYWGVFTDKDTKSLYVAIVDSSGSNMKVIYHARGCTGGFFNCDNPWSLSDIAWSPDGNSLAWGSSHANGEIWVSGKDSLSAKNLIYNGLASSFQWSPDGQFLAFYKDGDTFICTRDGLQEVLFFENAYPIKWLK